MQAGGLIAGTLPGDDESAVARDSRPQRPHELVAEVSVCRRTGVRSVQGSLVREFGAIVGKTHHLIDGWMDVHGMNVST